MIAGRFIAPANWELSFGVGENDRLDPQAVRSFLLETCQFRYIVNTVNNNYIILIYFVLLFHNKFLFLSIGSIEAIISIEWWSI